MIYDISNSPISLGIFRLDSSNGKFKRYCTKSGKMFLGQQKLDLVQEIKLLQDFSILTNISLQKNIELVSQQQREIVRVKTKMSKQI